MKELIKSVASYSGIDWMVLAAFVEVETGGKGFDQATKKLIIQFEPSWFKRLEPYAPSGIWSLNKVERQEAEWKAFNDAFKIDAEAAMQSTSIGLGQILGLHYKRLGYDTVGEMWDDAQRGEELQLNQLVTFLKTDPNLLKALKDKDWYKVAYIYNGPKFREYAAKWKRIPYDISLESAYKKLL